MNSYWPIYIFISIPLYLLCLNGVRSIIKNDHKWVGHLVSSIIVGGGILLFAHNIVINFDVAKLYLLNLIIFFFAIDSISGYLIYSIPLNYKKFFLYFVLGGGITFLKIEELVFILPLLYALGEISFNEKSKLLWGVDIIGILLYQILHQTHFSDIIQYIWIGRFLLFLYYHEKDNIAHWSSVLFNVCWMFILWHLTAPANFTINIFSSYIWISIIVFILFFIGGNKETFDEDVVLFAYPSFIALSSRSLILGTTFIVIVVFTLFIIKIQNKMVSTMSDNFNKYFIMTIAGFLLIALPGSPMFFLFTDFVKVAGFSVIELFLFAAWIFLYTGVVSTTVYAKGIENGNQQKTLISILSLLILISILSVFLLSRIDFYQLISYPVDESIFFMFKRGIAESKFRFFYIVIPFISTFVLILQYSYHKSSFLSLIRNWLSLKQISYRIRLHAYEENQILLEIPRFFDQMLSFIIHLFHMAMAGGEGFIVDFFKITSNETNKLKKEVQFLLFISMSLFIVLVFLSIRGVMP